MLNLQYRHWIWNDKLSWPWRWKILEKLLINIHFLEIRFRITHSYEFYKDQLKHKVWEYLWFKYVCTFSLLICTLRSDFEGGRKVVLQTRIFFWLETEKRIWVHTINPTFFRLQNHPQNHFWGCRLKGCNVKEKQRKIRGNFSDVELSTLKFNTYIHFTRYL